MIEAPDQNDNGCRLWTKRLDKAGYGRIGPRLAHRVAWERANGAIPDGMCVCHRCDVRNCVEVSHLFLGTQKENMEDMVSKGRSLKGRFRSTMCKFGHAKTLHGNGKMSCRTCTRDRLRELYARRAIEAGKPVAPRSNNQCRRGHDFSTAGEYWHRGSRKCVACMEMNRAKYRAKSSGEETGSAGATI